MRAPSPARLRKRFSTPESVDGEVLQIDTGYDQAVVLTVEKDGEIYYETYELTSVEKQAASSGSDK